VNLTAFHLPLAEISPWLVATWPIAVGVLGALAVLVALYALLSAFLPKVAPIVLTTAKAGLSHPLFWVELAFGAVVLILLFPFIPYYTLGEDIKMLKDSGLTLMLVLAVMFALLTSSWSIADEIDGRTAVTLLSKPIRRWQFIVGKFLGILVPVAMMFIVLGGIFLATVSYKASDDAHETAATQPTAAQCQAEMAQVLPGIVLAFLETTVLAAISVAISTRLPMLANLLICWTIYLLGHLMPAVVNSAVGQYPLVRFMGKFLATLLPNLDDFNIQAGIAAGSSVPLDYLGWAALYCALYTTAALVLALLLFEDRDLA
jgi:ABC-type transport system involved in multi-copper enzyme maturation permease subunit